VTQRPIPELLSSVNMVIENGTSVGFEGVAAGIEVLHVLSDISLDMDQLAFFPGTTSRARTPEEIRSAVHRLLGSEGNCKQSASARLRAAIPEIFSPSSENHLRAFLDYAC